MHAEWFTFQYFSFLGLEKLFFFHEILLGHNNYGESVFIWFLWHSLCMYEFMTSLAWINSCFDDSTSLCVSAQVGVLLGPTLLTWAVLTQDEDTQCEGWHLQSMLNESPGHGGRGWPSLMVNVQPSMICFRKRFDLNNLFFLFKGLFSAHHLVYFWIAVKIQWGSNFFKEIPLCLIKIYFWLLDLPVLFSPKALILNLLLLCVFPPRRLALLHGSASWQKQNQQNCCDCPQLLIKGKL